MAQPKTPSYTTTQLFVLIFCLVATVAALYAITLSLRGFDQDRISKLSNMSDLNVRPGLNVDTLPLVKIDYGKYKPGQNVPSNVIGEIDEEDRTDEIEENVAVRRTKCLSKGYYLGPNNNYVDCTTFCGISSDSEVEYTFIDQTSSRIYAGQTKIKAGAWCLPTTAASCNTSTSIVVYSLNGWFCLPQTDAFAGDGGNRIVVCNGKLHDGALNRTYENYIPNTVTFNDVYEDRLSNGDYRFSCPANLLDDLKNKYITSKYNRLHLLRNYCLEEIPFGVSANAVLNQNTGKCTCKDQYGEDTRTGRCSSCSPRFDPIEFTSHLYNRPCFSIRDYGTMLERLHNTTEHDDVILPCGIDDVGGVSKEPVNPRCLFTRVPVYSPLLPSNNTLRHIASVL